MAIEQGTSARMDLRIESMSEGRWSPARYRHNDRGGMRAAPDADHRTRRDRPHEPSPTPAAPPRRQPRPTRWATSSSKTTDLEQAIVDAVGLALPSRLLTTGLPRAVPGLRHPDGDGRAGTPPRGDRPALGEARLDAGTDDNPRVIAPCC